MSATIREHNYGRDPYALVEDDEGWLRIHCEEAPLSPPEGDETSRLILDLEEWR